jgi:hypothetical protein
MKSAVRLWQEFLAFCGARTPDDLLALDFVRASHHTDLADVLGRKQAARELRMLQALLTWRERNAGAREIASTRTAQQ